MIKNQKRNCIRKVLHTHAPLRPDLLNPNHRHSSVSVRQTIHSQYHQPLITTLLLHHQPLIIQQPDFLPKTTSSPAKCTRHFPAVLYPSTSTGTDNSCYNGTEIRRWLQFRWWQPDDGTSWRNGIHLRIGFCLSIQFLLSFSYTNTVYHVFRIIISHYFT